MLKWLMTSLSFLFLTESGFLGTLRGDTFIDPFLVHVKMIHLRNNWRYLVRIW